MEAPPDEAGESSPELHFLMKMSQLHPTLFQGVHEFEGWIHPGNCLQPTLEEPEGYHCPLE